MTPYKPLLSICIPTYNDATNLDLTLRSIVNSPSFINSYDIQVVLSDNNSDDDTNTLCIEYSDKYKHKIIYIKNHSNLGDINFGLALSHATGKIRKLHNTDFQFLDGALDILLKLIKININSKPVLFLTNNLKSIRDQSLYICENLDDFLLNVSFVSTWIGGFFIWEEDFISAENFSSYSNCNLSQTEVLFNTIKKRKKTVVINEKILVSSRQSGRGGYNIAVVFSKNYLNLIKIYLASGEVSLATFENAKKRVLLEHILPSFLDKKNSFQNDTLLPYLSDFQNDEYFYLAMLKVIRLKNSSNI